MSTLYLDLEVYADREADLQALYAELAAEDDGAELLPIIQDELPDFDGWEWAA